MSYVDTPRTHLADEGAHNCSGEDQSSEHSETEHDLQHQLGHAGSEAPAGKQKIGPCKMEVVFKAVPNRPNWILQRCLLKHTNGCCPSSARYQVGRATVQCQVTWGLTLVYCYQEQRQASGVRWSESKLHTLATKYREIRQMGTSQRARHFKTLLFDVGLLAYYTTPKARFNLAMLLQKNIVCCSTTYVCFPAHTMSVDRMMATTLDLKNSMSGCRPCGKNLLAPNRMTFMLRCCWGVFGNSKQRAHANYCRSFGCPVRLTALTSVKCLTCCED